MFVVQVRYCTPGELVAALTLHCWTLPDGMQLFRSVRSALLAVSQSFANVLKRANPLDANPDWTSSLRHRDLISTGYFDWTLQQVEANMAKDWQFSAIKKTSLVVHVKLSVIIHFNLEGFKHFNTSPSWGKRREHIPWGWKSKGGSDTGQHRLYKTNILLQGL